MDSGCSSQGITGARKISSRFFGGGLPMRTTSLSNGTERDHWPTWATPDTRNRDCGFPAFSGSLSITKFCKLTLSFLKRAALRTAHQKCTPQPRGLEIQIRECFDAAESRPLSIVPFWPFSKYKHHLELIIDISTTNTARIIHCLLDGVSLWCSRWTAGDDEDWSIRSMR